MCLVEGDTVLEVVVVEEEVRGGGCHRGAKTVSGRTGSSAWRAESLIMRVCRKCEGGWRLRVRERWGRSNSMAV